MCAIATSAPLFFSAAAVLAEDRLDPQGGEVVNDGEYVRFDKDGTDVNLGEFDPADMRMTVGDLLDGVCTAARDCPDLDIGTVLLHPEEYTDAIEVAVSGGGLGHFLANLFATLDNGIDADGDPNGAAGDGQIDRDEMSNRAYGTIRAWQAVDDDAWTDAVDYDRDGLVGLEEFVQATADANADSATLERHEAMTRFKAADKNGDNWLSEADVARYRNPLWEGGRMKRWAVNVYLLELDSDEDGALSLAEYVAVGRGTFTNETSVPVSALEHEFEQLDVDLSGDVSLFEISQLPQARITSMLSMAVNAFFAVADTDEDGVVSPAELEGCAPVLETLLDPNRVPRPAGEDEDGGHVEDSYGDAYDHEGGLHEGGHAGRDEF